MHEVKILKPDKNGNLKLIKVIKPEALELRWTKNKKFSLNRKSVMQKPINNYVPEA